MQDIVPKKSIREITKPHAPGVSFTRASHVNEQKKAPEEVRDIHEAYPHTQPDLYRTEKKRGWVFILFILALFAGVGIFLHLQKSATVYLSTTQKPLVFKDTEIRIPIDNLTVLVATTTKTIDIITSTGTPILTKAKGTVTIYNANTTEQALVASTRLETPDGKIYRLDSKITVPKASVVAGKTTPGSIQALVTAEKVGESYNITQADFTFPGLVGSPRYKNVYARTKGAFLGGKETSTRLVDEKDKNTKIEALSKENAPALTAKLEGQKSINAITIQEPALATTFEKISETKGTVIFSNTMSVIDTKEFATLLAKNQQQNIVGDMEFVENSNKLTIEYVSSDKTSVQITVNGTVSVRSYIDTLALKALLTGKPFSQFRELIKQIPGVEESKLSSKPFWATAFPQASRIFVEQN